MSQPPPPNIADRSSLQTLPIPCIFAATLILWATPIRTWWSEPAPYPFVSLFVVRLAAVMMPRHPTSPYSRERPPNLNDANFPSSQAGGSAVGPEGTLGNPSEDSESASTGEGSNTAGSHASSGTGNLRPYIRAIAELGVDSFATPRLTTESLLAHNHRSACPSYPEGVDSWRRDGHPFPVAHVEGAIPAASDSMRAARHPQSHATDLTVQNSMPSTVIRDMEHDINGAGTRFDDEVAAPSCYDDIGDFAVTS